MTESYMQVGTVNQQMPQWLSTALPGQSYIYTHKSGKALLSWQLGKSCGDWKCLLLHRCDDVCFWSLCTQSHAVFRPARLRQAQKFCLQTFSWICVLNPCPANEMSNILESTCRDAYEDSSHPGDACGFSESLGMEGCVLRKDVGSVLLRSVLLPSQGARLRTPVAQRLYSWYSVSMEESLECFMA